MAALAFASKASGFSESTGDFHLSKMLEGWSREQGARCDSREPLSPRVLRGLRAQWSVLCSGNFEAALFHAAALIAFFGAFRVGELVTRSKADSSGRALQMDDVRLGSSSVQFTLRFSKTDQRGKGALFSLGVCDDMALCPVLAVRQYLALRGSSGGYLFIHRNLTPLTRYQFWVVTRKALDGLGLSGLSVWDSLIPNWCCVHGGCHGLPASGFAADRALAVFLL